MNRRIVLIVSGLAVTFILLLIYRRDVVFRSRSNSSNSSVTEIQPSPTTSTPTAINSRTAEIASSPPTNTSQFRDSGTSLSARFVSPAEVSKLYVKLTESSNPDANQLFRDCLRLIDQGNYREARLKLRAFMDGKSLKGNEYIPPAWWISAWCTLKEGGRGNLVDAADRFSIYAKLWPAPGEPYSVSTEMIARDYEELTKAALFNSAVIYMNLLYTEQDEQDKYTKNAAEALNSFLTKWPNDPKTPEVRYLLDGLNGSRPRL
jgi:TolA-binding protein